MAIAMQAELEQREFIHFCEKQCNARKLVPTREEYFTARLMAHDVENPPPLPVRSKFNLWLTKFLMWVFRV